MPVYIYSYTYSCQVSNTWSDQCNSSQFNTTHADADVLMLLMMLMMEMVLMVELLMLMLMLMTMTVTTWKGEKHKAVEVSLLYILQDLMETPVSPAATGGDADCLHNKSLAAHPPPSPFYISTSATKSSFKWSSTLILKASSKQHCTCHNIFIQTHVKYVVLPP